MCRDEFFSRLHWPLWVQNSSSGQVPSLELPLLAKGSKSSSVSGPKNHDSSLPRPSVINAVEELLSMPHVRTVCTPSLGTFCFGSAWSRVVGHHLFFILPLFGTVLPGLFLVCHCKNPSHIPSQL